jgi:hypothetical protein
MALQFTRNAKVYVEFNDTHVWEVPVLDGFSFSQAINSSEITINEAGVTSRRARLLFNDNLAPVEWSMSTYARPFRSTASPAYTQAPEDPLWAMLLGADTFTPATGLFHNSIIGDASPGSNVNTPTLASNIWDFSGSNTSSFGTSTTKVNIYFSFEDGSNIQVYKCSDAVVNSVTVDFDIDGIATLQWSGFSADITDSGASPGVVPTVDYSEAITSTANFIRNRISTVDLVRTDVSPDDTYSIVLTGGSFSIENNINYLVPEELGVVNKPLANITGARSISGNITCYLDNDIASDKSGELFADLVADTATVRNVFNMAVNIGGTAADGSAPNFSLDLPTAHLEVPIINVEDLLTLDVTFHGQVSNGNVDNTDEATIVYRGVTL